MESTIVDPLGYQFVHLDQEVEEKDPFADTELINNYKVRCWVCLKPCMNLTGAEDENVNLLKELCRTLSLNRVIPPEIGEEIKNDDFCYDCCRAIRQSINIMEHVKRLGRKLQGLQNLLQKNMKTTYWSNQITDDPCPETNAKKFVRKTMVQCLSDCSVHVVVGKCSKIKIKRPLKQVNQKLNLSATSGRPKRESPKKISESGSLKTVNVDEVINAVIVGSSLNETEPPEDDWFPESNDQDPDYEPELLENGEASKTLEPIKRKLESFRVSTSPPQKLNRTKKIQWKNRSFKCFTCGKLCRSHALFEEHIELDHGADQLFPCEICDKKFTNKRQLSNHIRNHHLTPNCPYCGMNFDCLQTTIQSQDGKMLSESLNNITPENFKLMYKSESSRRKHVKFCTKKPSLANNSIKEVPTHHCGQCDKTYVTLAALKSHVASIHNKSFKFCCDVCGLGFQVNSMLTRHVKYVHSTEKNYECDLCHQKFKRPHQLFYHQRRHTGELPYICEVCGKGFHVHEKLRTHLKIHEANKSNPCPICGKLFICKQYVANHIFSTHKKSRKTRPRGVGNNSGGQFTGATSADINPAPELDPSPKVEIFKEDLNEHPVLVETEEVIVTTSNITEKPPNPYKQPMLAPTTRKRRTGSGTVATKTTPKVSRSSHKPEILYAGDNYVVEYVI